MKSKNFRKTFTLFLVLTLQSLNTFTASQADESSFHEFSILAHPEIETEGNIDREDLINSGLTPEQSEIILYAKNEEQYKAEIQSIYSRIEDDWTNRNTQPIPPELNESTEVSKPGHAIQANAPVSHYWTNREGKQINLRRNIKTKIENKHNLTGEFPELSPTTIIKNIMSTGKSTHTKLTSTKFAAQGGFAGENVGPLIKLQ